MNDIIILNNNEQNLNNILKEKNLYKILNLNKNSTDTEIKSSYKKMALRFHDDKNRNQPTEIKKLIRKVWDHIQQAYSILIDPEKRKYYDKNNTIDGYETNSIEKELINIIMSTIRESDFRGNYKTKNLIKICEDKIYNEIIKVKEIKGQLKNLCKYIRKIKRKLKNKKGNNFIKPVLNQELESLKTQLNKCKETYKEYNQMLKLLKNWTYDFEVEEYEFTDSFSNNFRASLKYYEGS